MVRITWKKKIRNVPDDVKSLPTPTQHKVGAAISNFSSIWLKLSL